MQEAPVADLGKAHSAVSFGADLTGMPHFSCPELLETVIR
jgi:hypothetical protein